MVNTLNTTVPYLTRNLFFFGLLCYEHDGIEITWIRAYLVYVELIKLINHDLILHLPRKSHILLMILGKFKLHINFS